MALANVWGTDIELIAVATLFQLPVYYFMTDTKWGRIEPLEQEFQRPVVDESDEPPVGIRRELTHFEVQYIRGCHYNSIVDSANEDTTRLDFPDISVHHQSIDINDLI